MTIMRPKKHAGGFTLIELLVVITIIGILATLILVALNTARDRARSVRVTSDINQIRNAAELFFDAGNTYVNFDAANTDVDKLKKDIEKYDDPNVAMTTKGAADKFCAKAKRKLVVEPWICVDSTLAVVEQQGDFPNCPTNNSC